MAIAAIRFNNPGNVSLPIRGYDGPGSIVGIKGQPGYASFPTVADGLRAQSIRLASYIDNGVNRSGPLTSIAALNSRYAGDPNWKNAVSRFSGIGVNERLDPNNAQQMSALQGAIIRQETGKDPSAFGFSPSGGGMSQMAPASDGLLYSDPSVETRAGSNIVDFKSATGNENDAYEVTLGFDDEAGTSKFGGSGGIDASSFSRANMAGPSGAGSFGLSGPQANGQGVSSAFPNSLEGATLDKGVTASSVTGQASGSGGGAGSGDPIVGYNSAGPVIGASTVTGAINTSGQKVSGSVDKGAKQIGDDTKEAGKTIGQSVTGLAGTFKGISDGWQSWATDTFLRLAFIVAGLVVFAAALLYFARPQVEAAAGAVANALPAGKALKALKAVT